MTLLATTPVEKVKGIELVLVAEGGHIFEEHLVEEGLLLRRLLG